MVGNVDYMPGIFFFQALKIGNEKKNPSSTGGQPFQQGSVCQHNVFFLFFSLKLAKLCLKMRLNHFLRLSHPKVAKSFCSLCLHL